MSALPEPPRGARRAMTVRDLAAVVAIEIRAYAFPWSRGNFVDALSAGYHAEVLEDARGAPIGYFVAMPGVDELHLLNITVDPAHQRHGHGSGLLDAVAARARTLGLSTVWLEVRTSNPAAKALYERHGYLEVGRRRGYYPAPGGREDAIVMRRASSASSSASASARQDPDAVD